jgi:gluconokinase
MSGTAPRPARELRLIIVMGVSGCGKTSVGQGIAASLNIPFVEGDALHPRSNVEKMSAGIPLDDADRGPWLDRIGDELRNAHHAGHGLVVACSALKKIYRDRLRQASEDGLYFVFLRASRDALQERVAARRNHYMPPSLLDSQLAILELPDDEPRVISVDIDRIDVAQAIAAAQAELEKLRTLAI